MTVLLLMIVLALVSYSTQSIFQMRADIEELKKDWTTQSTTESNLKLGMYVVYIPSDVLISI